MKCPKCGYHSFDHLDNCKKCKHDLSAHKTKFSLHGFFAPGATAAPAPAPAPAPASAAEEFEEPADNGTVDFGFDFLEEEDPFEKAAAGIPLDKGAGAINIDQPFAADGETVPAGTAGKETKDKAGKGPEFAF